MQSSQKIEQAPFKTTKTWAKSRAEWALWFWGWSDFIHALRAYYLADNELPATLDDNTIPKASIEDCFVNLALVNQDVYTNEETRLREREDWYQELLRSDETKTISDLFSTEDLYYRLDTGWAFITGQAGTGKTTLGQHISYRWAQSEFLWNNRFEFVFRVKLNLVGRQQFWDGCKKNEGKDYLAWMIHKSLGSPTKPLSLKKIRKCIEDHPQQVLIMLDGFDEVSGLYQQNTDARLTALINAAMTFPNGVLTSRPLLQHRFPRPTTTKLRYFENLGLKEHHVQHYVEQYFRRISETEKGQSLLELLTNNPRMMGLAQIPLHIAAMCLIWREEEQRPISTMTDLYQRILTWLARRYVNNFKLTHEEKAADISAATMPKTEVLERCQAEFQKLSALAYEGFATNQIQTLDHGLLNKYFPNIQELLNITMKFGVLRCEATPTPKREEYPKHYFIHLTYQEYFAAVYIAEQLSSKPLPTRPEELERRQKVQVLTQHIRDNRNNSNYRVIWQFLAGLMSTTSYNRGADYFWAAMMEDIRFERLATETDIGLHQQVKALQKIENICLEGLLMADADSNPRIPITLAKLRALLAWGLVQKSEILVKDWSDVDPNPKEIQRRQQHERRQKQRKADLRHLGVEGVSEISLTTLLMGMPLWAQKVNVLREFLGNSQSDMRIEAANTLAQLGIRDAEVIQLFKNCLRDSENFVRNETEFANSCLGLQAYDIRSKATNILVRLGIRDPDIIQLFKDCLRDSKGYIRVEAAFALVRLGIQDAEVIQTLKESLKNSKSHDLNEAMAALSRFGIQNKEMRKAFMIQVSDFRRDSRFMVAETLVGLGFQEEEIIIVLQEVWRDSDGHNRFKAAETLAKLGFQDQEIIIVLRELLKHSEDYIRGKAAETLAKLGFQDQEIIIVLPELLKHSEHYIRGKAAETLAKLGFQDQEIIIVLRELLKHSDHNIRGKAVETLVRLGFQDEEIIQALIELLSSYPNICDQAANDLVRLGIQDALTIQTSLKGLLSDSWSHTRRGAAYVLCHLPLTTETLKDLLYTLHYQNDQNIAPLPCVDNMETLSNLFLAIVRTPPQVYLSLPIHTLTISTTQYALVVSTWLHGSSLEIDHSALILDGVDRYPFFQNELDLPTFMHALQIQQTQLIERLNLRDVMYPLMSSPARCTFINAASEGFLTEGLPEETTSHLLELSLRMQAVEAKTTELSNRVETLNENQDKMQEKVIKMWAELSGKLNLEEIDSNMNQAERAYIQKFKYTLVQMYIVSMIACQGSLQLASTGAAGTVATILSILSGVSPIPMGGIALSGIAYLFQAMNEELALRRMEKITHLGSTPEEVTQIAVDLSHRLLHCLKLAHHIQHGSLQSLLSAASEMFGFYEVLFDEMQDSDTLITTLSDHEKRAEQDANLLLAAIVKEDVPKKNGHLDTHRLFLYAAPLLTLTERLFAKLLQKFCEKNQYELSQIRFNSEKRRKFFGQILNSWHKHAERVALKIDAEDKESFIQDLATCFTDKRHADNTTGFFYFKTGHTIFSSHTSIRNQALEPATIEAVIEQCLN